MPPLQPVPKVIRVALSGTDSDGAVIANRIFLQYSGALSSTDLNTVTNTVFSSWTTNLAPALSNNFTLSTLVSTDLSSNVAPQIVKTVASAGGSAVAPLAAATCAVIQFKIARRFRGGHPRFYLGPLPSGNLSASVWNSTFLTNTLSSWNAFIAACIAAPPAAVGTLSHVAVHYFSGFSNKLYPSGREHPVPTALGTPTVDVITGYGINPNPGTQRRRNHQSK